MSEQKKKDAKIQDLPAKPVGREQGEAVKGGALGPKTPPKPIEPVNG